MRNIDEENNTVATEETAGILLQKLPDDAISRDDRVSIDPNGDKYIRAAEETTPED
jgi:hypothetical protein